MILSPCKIRAEGGATEQKWTGCRELEGLVLQEEEQWKRRYRAS